MLASLDIKVFNFNRWRKVKNVFVFQGETIEEDIHDSNEFSIEQARSKLEWDKLVEAGEDRKRETRKQISELRMRFKRLKDQNERLPAHMRINTRVSSFCRKLLCKESSYLKLNFVLFCYLKVFEMLDRLRQQLLNHRQEQVDILYKETAFESRRKSIRLQKLINRQEPIFLWCDLVMDLQPSSQGFEFFLLTCLKLYLLKFK